MTIGGMAHKRDKKSPSENLPCMPESEASIVLRRQAGEPCGSCYNLHKAFSHLNHTASAMRSYGSLSRAGPRLRSMRPDRQGSMVRTKITPHRGTELGHGLAIDGETVLRRAQTITAATSWHRAVYMVRRSLTISSGRAHHGRLHRGGYLGEYPE